MLKVIFKLHENPREGRWVFFTKNGFFHASRNWPWFDLFQFYEVDWSMKMTFNFKLIWVRRVSTAIFSFFLIGGHRIYVLRRVREISSGVSVYIMQTRCLTRFVNPVRHKLCHERCFSYFHAWRVADVNIYVPDFMRDVWQTLIFTFPDYVFPVVCSNIFSYILLGFKKN